MNHLPQSIYIKRGESFSSMNKFIFGETPAGNLLKCAVNLIILNLLWVLCSLPIITMGPATVALYTSISALSRGEERMTPTFFKGLRRNFKQSLILWLITLFIGFMLYWSLYIVSFWENTRSLALIFLTIPCFIYLMILSYAFPLLAEFETSLPKLLANSILLSIGHFPRSTLMVVINLLPILIMFLMPSWFVCAIFIWLPIGFALCAFLNYKLLTPVFAPFRPKEPDVTVK